MRQTVVVDVTQADIDSGTPCEYTACPIALALRRAVGGEASEIYVDEAVAKASIGWGWMPDDAAAFVVAFDDRQPVQPFTFTLTLENGACLTT